MNKTLGEYIRQLRDKKDFSLREFAEKLGGLSAAFLSDIELGRRYPSEKVLEDMARVLGIELEEFKKYDNRPPVQDMKKLIQKNPQYGFAFRTVIDKEISPEELIKVANRSRSKKKSA